MVGCNGVSIHDDIDIRMMPAYISMSKKHLANDRSGELCPFCKEGKLYPTGSASEERNEKVRSGETGRAERRYACDKCGKETTGASLDIG